MFFQHKSEIEFCALCDAMLEDFALPDLNDENKDLHLRLGNFIAKLSLLAWNVTLVKPSLAAAKKGIEQINRQVFCGDDFTALLLCVAADWKWNKIFACKEYFADGKVSLEDGRLTFHAIRESEAGGRGILFTEFRKIMKSGNAGRAMAILMKERFNFCYDKDQLLIFKKLLQYHQQLFTDEAEFTPLLTLQIRSARLGFSCDSCEDADFSAQLISGLIFSALSVCNGYDDMKKYFVEYCKTEVSTLNNRPDSLIVMLADLALAVELFHGHVYVFDDADLIEETVRDYIPERYLSGSENLLRQYCEAYAAVREDKVPSGLEE